WIARGASPVADPSRESASTRRPAVEAAVLDRLRQVRRADRLRPFDVGDGPSHLEHTVEGAHREAELLEGAGDERVPLGVETAKGAELARVHAGVGVDRSGGEPLALDLAGPRDPGGDGRGAFARRGVEVSHAQPGDLDVQVDPVEERAGD